MRTTRYLVFTEPTGDVVGAVLVPDTFTPSADLVGQAAARRLEAAVYDVGAYGYQDALLFGLREPGAALLAALEGVPCAHPYQERRPVRGCAQDWCTACGAVISLPSHMRHPS